MTADDGDEKSAADVACYHGPPSTVLRLSVRSLCVSFDSKQLHR